MNKQQELIFKNVELDSDQEIPAPIGFDKRKQNLLNLKNEDIDEAFNEITQPIVPMPKEDFKPARVRSSVQPGVNSGIKKQRLKSSQPNKMKKDD